MQHFYWPKNYQSAQNFAEIKNREFLAIEISCWQQWLRFSTSENMYL